MGAALSIPSLCLRSSSICMLPKYIFYDKKKYHHKIVTVFLGLERQIAQQVKVCALLAEDLDSIFRTHVTAHTNISNSSSRGSSMGTKHSQSKDSTNSWHVKKQLYRADPQPVRNGQCCSITTGCRTAVALENCCITNT